MKFNKEKVKTYYINKNKGLVSKEIAENNQCKLEIISASNLFDSSVISKVRDFVWCLKESRKRFPHSIIFL